jgi:hypothetical protein
MADDFGGFGDDGDDDFGGDDFGVWTGVTPVVALTWFSLAQLVWVTTPAYEGPFACMRGCNDCCDVFAHHQPSMRTRIPPPSHTRRERIRRRLCRVSTSGGG